MNARLLAVLALFLPLVSLSAHTYVEAPELGKCFADKKARGTFALLDPATDTVMVWNEARAKERFTPASTFKITNSLIGLDTGAVRNVDEVLPYGGKPQRFKHWERDMPLRDAIVASNVPIYQELARRIGLERMRAGVKKLGYGNMEIGSVVDRFWLEGPLAISAVEQTEFLGRLAEGKLLVSPEATRAVKEITLVEKSDVHELHGKTGWHMDEKRQIGWWVGWVERDGKVYPFALNIDMQGNDDAAKRVPLGRDCLKALNKL